MPRTVAFNWIDWLTLALVLASGLRGSRSGAPAELFDLFGLVATYFTAAVYFLLGAEYLSQIPGLTPPWQGFVAFVAIWIGLYLPLSWVIRWALTNAKFPASGVLGALVGVARGLVIAAALLVLMLATPYRSVIAADAHHSKVAPYLLRGNSGFQRFLRTNPVGMRVPRLGPGGTMF
jgi:uncharacterized membrane protein required for colicin V production